MSKDIRIKKGVDIQLFGQADLKLENATRSTYYTIKPTDFTGVTPKLHVREGAKVDVGTPVFYDKNTPDVNFVSPVSGEITEIKRGAKRKMLEIIIKADTQDEYVDMGSINLDSSSREDLLQYLLKSGVWPFVRQIPYAVIADPAITPKSINVSAFNSAPLSADDSFMIEGQGAAFQKGLDALKKLTSGNVDLNVKAKTNSSTVFTNATGVTKNTFDGPHPAGNSGVQIHHLNPVNKGEVSWYLRPQAVVAIGNLLLNSKYDPTRIVALAGEEVSKPQYYKAIQGANVADIVGNSVSNDNVRYVSGDVLTGEKVEKDAHINFYANELSVIAEGNEPDFLGWALPGASKLSLSRTFFAWLTPKKKYSVTTNLRGEERAYVVTGQYEQYFPMDIYPQQLIKAALANDIELMEELGIYEVTPEDFALCEFACTSKIEIQEIIREALDLVKKELS